MRIKGKLIAQDFISGKREDLSVGTTSESACCHPASRLMHIRDPVVSCLAQANRIAQQEISSRGVVTEWKQETGRLRVHWMVGTKNVNTILGGESSVKHPLVKEEEKDGGTLE